MDDFIDVYPQKDLVHEQRSRSAEEFKLLASYLKLNHRCEEQFIGALCFLSQTGVRQDMASFSLVKKVLS